LATNRRLPSARRASRRRGQEHLRHGNFLLLNTGTKPVQSKSG
jgi:hypothetical protein